MIGNKATFPQSFVDIEKDVSSRYAEMGSAYKPWFSHVERFVSRFYDVLLRGEGHHRVFIFLESFCFPILSDISVLLDLLQRSSIA